MNKKAIIKQYNKNALKIVFAKNKAEQALYYFFHYQYMKHLHRCINTGE